MSTSKFGPGWPGNTKTSDTARDADGLPTRVNQGDACMNMPETPLKGVNKQGPAGTDGVMYGITKPGKGVGGRAVGSKLSM